MKRGQIERDMLFALEFVTGVMSLLIAVRLLGGQDSMRVLRMRYLRAVSRSANRVADKATTIANSANTAYWTVAQK